MAKICSLVLVVVLGSLSSGAETDPAAEAYTVPCEPTAGVWYVPPGSSPQVMTPPLAVVDTDIRPERARLFLDGSFIGLADDFDGYPDFLYLQPGSYRLEGRLGGYVTVVFEIEAEPGCRHDIRHSMPRVPGVEKEGWDSEPAGPVPFKRVYPPAAAAGSEEAAARRRVPGRADPSLRPDLARRLDAGSPPPDRPGGASLRLQVEPPTAAVYIDGAFTATGEELAKLVGPLAVTPGTHRLAIMAPGHATHEQDLVVAAGDQLELHVALEALEAEP